MLHLFVSKKFGYLSLFLTFAGEAMHLLYILDSIWIMDVICVLCQNIAHLCSERRLWCTEF